MPSLAPPLRIAWKIGSANKQTRRIVPAVMEVWNGTKVRNGTKKGRVSQAHELFQFAFFSLFYYNAKSVSFQIAEILLKGNENNKNL